MTPTSCGRCAARARTSVWSPGWTWPCTVSGPGWSPACWPSRPRGPPGSSRGTPRSTGTAPRELGTIVNLRHAPPAPWLPPGLHGRPVVLIGVCWTGADEGLDRLLAPLRALRPLADTVGAVPYTEHQRLFDAAVPHGLHYFWRSDYVTGLGGQVAEALSEHSWSMRNRRSYTIMFHLGGALADLDPGAAAFSGRHDGFAININAVWAPPEPDDVAWVREQWARIHGFSAGVYVNFLDDEPGPADPGRLQRRRLPQAGRGQAPV